MTVVTEGGLRWCPLPFAFWWEPPALAGGRPGFWWEPPALAGGAGLQSSEKAFNYKMGFIDHCISNVPYGIDDSSLELSLRAKRGICFC